MDYKVKGFQSFSGVLLQTSVKVSQRAIDIMTDDDLLKMRKLCSDFELAMFAILSPYHHQIDKTLLGNETETTTETNTETNTETDTRGKKP